MGGYCFTGVCLSVHTIQVTILIFGMQVAFDNTQLVRIISSRSRSNIKVQQYPTSKGHIIKVKVQYQGYISEKMAVSGALVFYKHVFFLFHSWFLSFNRLVTYTSIRAPDERVDWLFVFKCCFQDYVTYIVAASSPTITSTPHNGLSKLVSHIPTVETMYSGERGRNPVTMTIIGPWIEY